MNLPIGAALHADATINYYELLRTAAVEWASASLRPAADAVTCMAVSKDIFRGDVSISQLLKLFVSY